MQYNFFIASSGASVHKADQTIYRWNHDLLIFILWVYVSITLLDNALFPMANTNVTRK